jgi:hypothetical protein
VPGVELRSPQTREESVAPGTGTGTAKADDQSPPAVASSDEPPSAPAAENAPEEAGSKPSPSYPSELYLWYGDLSDSEHQAYRRLEREGYFVRKVASDSLATRIAESFEPEVVRLGKHTTLTCSLITAIKHKNPLCLINPYFLVLTW